MCKQPQLLTKIN